MTAEGVTVKINQKYNSEVSSIVSHKSRTQHRLESESSRGKSQTKYRADT